MDAKLASGLNQLSATEIVSKIEAGDTTCEAVTRDCLARIAAREPVVKAWVNFDPELALAQARVEDGHQAKRVAFTKARASSMEAGSTRPAVSHSSRHWEMVRMAWSS